MTNLRQLPFVRLFSPQEKGSLTLFCFSPPVMLATFIIELTLAIYVLIHYGGKALFNKLLIATLLCLGSFQAIEYAICEIMADINWAKIGIAAITMLPALGLHMMSLLTKRSWFVWLGYALAIAYVAYFCFFPGATQGAVCGGNYVILNLRGASHWGLYYFGFLIIALLEGFSALYFSKTPLPKHTRLAIGWLLFGYLSFMLPMAITYIVSAAARQAVPSVMCGFAVILALTLAFAVMPYSMNRQRH